MMTRIVNVELQNSHIPKGLSPVAPGWKIIKILLLAILLGLLVAGCADGVVNDIDFNENDAEVSNGEEDSTMKEQREATGLARPPIDMEIPDNLETATLGMG